MRPSLPPWWLGAALLAAGALLAYPLRHGGAFLDDFLFLALGRHVANPLALVTQDAVGAYFFRPLPLLSWWATVGLFGTAAPAQLACNVALHVVNGALLYALLRRLGAGLGAAALACLVFVAHPTAFAASAWLSDRFDLLSTAFGLAALVAIERFLLAPRRRTLALAAAALLASLLSKEIGYVFAAAAALLIAWPAADHAASRGARLAMLAAVCAASAAALGARALALRDVAQPLFAAHGWIATIATGVPNWIERLPGFLVVQHGGRAAIAAWGAFLALLAAAAAVGGRRPERACARIALLGLAIMASAAVAQSPVLGTMQFRPFGAGPFVFESLAASRLYYVALAGFAMVVAAFAQHAAGTPRPRAARLAFAALAVAAVAGLLATSRTIGREWAAYARATTGPVLDAAVAALGPRTDARPGCKVYLLDMPDVPGLTQVIDVAVKQALPRGHPLMGCFIQGERTPWYNLVETRGLAQGAERPLRTLLFNGKPFAPLRVSNLAYFYLEPPDASQAVADPGATFLAYEKGRFVDVGADVRSHRRAVRLADVPPGS